MTIKNHSYKLRVFYEDTDAGGVVYHANYLKYFERARTEWLRDLDIHQSSFLEQQFAFVVRHMDIHYHSPAKLDDLLEVRTSVTKLKRASIIFSQEVVDQNGQLLSSATVLVASVNLETSKPVAIPKTIVGALKSVC